MREIDERVMSENGYCAEQMLGHLSEEPVTFDELEIRIPGVDSLALRYELEKLRRKGLITYLEAGEGGPGWVRASRST